jgi:hypothetical protein
MWVEFISLRSLDQWIHYFLIESNWLYNNNWWIHLKFSEITWRIQRRHCYSTTKDYYYFLNEIFLALQSWTTQTRLIECKSFPQDPKNNEKKKKAFLLLLFWVFLAHLNSNQAFLLVQKLKLAPQGLFYTMSQGPRFNSNQAFLLVQKLKSDPSALTLTWD